MNVQELEAMRRQKDQYLKASPHSPLTPEQQDLFTGLTYYDYNPDLVMDVTMEPVTDNREIILETTTDQVRQATRYGRFAFMVDGQEVKLTVYETPHGYFLPFTDTNAGTETYPAGRYLEPDELPDGRLHVDFNQAYNPFCAFNAGWSCPVTPAENRLKVAIRAGEKLPVGDWVTHG
jgi:uncharacterized protein (DUF1684 family)